MKVMMFVCRDDHPDADDRDQIQDWVDEANQGHRRLDGGPFHGLDQSVSVRLRNGQLTRVQGPAESRTNELLGFDLLEVKDMERPWFWPVIILWPGVGESN